VRVVVECRWFRLDVRFGAIPAPEPDRGEVQLDAYVEPGAPDPHPRSELDGRHPPRPVGFGGPLWR
jgi:hypothetical protein